MNVSDSINDNVNGYFGWMQQQGFSHTVTVVVFIIGLVIIASVITRILFGDRR